MTKNLVSVAPNLYRNPRTGEFIACRKINGKRRTKNLGTTNQVRAASSLHSWLITVESLDDSAETYKLGALLELLLLSKSGLKAKTKAFYLTIGNVFRATFPTGMNFRVSQLRHSHFVEWLCAQEVKRQWSPTTYNTYRRFLRELCLLAEAERIFTALDNPFKPLLLKPRKARRIERRWPTVPQFYALIDAVRAGGRHPGDGAASADFLQFLGEAGVGQAEAIDLKWRNVDTETARIHFVRRKTGAPFSVPIYPWLLPLLDRLRANSKPDYRLAPNTHVFNIENPKRALESACRRLGFPHFSPRNLRQCFIARLADCGVEARQIALWQGHNDGGVLIQSVYRNGISADDQAIERANIALLA